MNYSEYGKKGYLKTKKAMESHCQELKDAAIKKFKENKKKCHFCNKDLPYKKRKNKFCDHSCSTKYNNIGVAKNPKKIRICKGCGNLIDRKSCYYCSTCYNSGKNKNVIPFEKLKTDQRRKIRLLSERGNICEICGRKKWMGRDIPLVLDHIDGDSNRSTRDNLRLVCGNCDMQLPTYKSKNKGKGRAYRRERYKEGKSY